MIKILIADDHAIVREGLKQIIADVSDMVISGEAGNAQEAMEEVRKGNYDVLVLDFSMPGGSGLDVLKNIKNEKPELPVLMLSIHPEEQYAVRLLRAGASGYLTKESASDELIAAIRRVSQGRKYITTTLAEKLVGDLEFDSEKPRHETLSDREYQIFSMIASGKTVGEIAEELFLSVKTVSTYRTRVLEKMRMKNNTQLTRYALKNNLLD